MADNKNDRHVNMTHDQAEAASKALNFTTGYGITPDTQSGAAALRPESLDRDVRDLAYTARDLTIFKDLSRINVTQSVTKYTVWDRNGKVGHSRFVPEVGLSSLNAPNLKQHAVDMKYMIDVGQRSFVTSFINNIENPEQILEQHSLLALAKSIEWATFYGNSNLKSSADDTGLEFDGLVNLIDKDNVIDLRGESMTPNVINQAAVVIGKGFGVPTDMYMPIGVQADFINQHMKATRVMAPTSNGTTQFGINVDTFMSSRGPIKMHGSTIMDNDNILDETEVIDGNAPFAPSAVTADVQTGAEGKFTEDDLGDAGVNYKVVVVSHQYNQKASNAVNAVLANTTDKVTLTITLSNVQRVAPDYVAVYRQGKHSGLYFLIGRKSLSEAEADGTIKFEDVNDVIPETADVFIGELTPNTIGLFQLIPFFKFPLAVVTTATQFALMWGGALALFAPKRWVRLKNVNYVNAYTAPQTYNWQ